MKGQVDTTKPKVKIDNRPSRTSKVCSSYDEDCKDVPDPLYCFMGTKCNVGIADGICPLLTNLN